MMGGIHPMFPKVHKEEFITEIRKNFIYSIDRSINEIVIVVLSVLRKHVSEGEVWILKVTGF